MTQRSAASMSGLDFRADMEAADLRARQRRFAAGLAATAEKAWIEHDRRQRGRQDYYQRGDKPNPAAQAYRAAADEEKP